MPRLSANGCYARSPLVRAVLTAKTPMFVPDRSPSARVEEILFPESEVLLIADARGRQLYIVGDQRMSAT